MAHFNNSHKNTLMCSNLYQLYDLMINLPKDINRIF